MSLGDDVRWRREALGLSQAELARRIRVNRRAPDRSYICRLEAGQVDPRLSTVRSLARALGVKPWMLLVELGESIRFWQGYLLLSGKQKREVQQHIAWLLRRRG